MPRANWKVAESKFASFFGTRRRPLSGGNQGGGRDDSLHPRLFLECKYGASPAPWSLFEATRQIAGERIPILGIRKRSKRGFLLVIHSFDFASVVVEYLIAKGLSPSVVQAVKTAIFDDDET